MDHSDVEKPSLAQSGKTTQSSDERTPLQRKGIRGSFHHQVLLTRIVTFSNAFIEGYESSIFALILVPVRKSMGLTKYEICVFAVVPMLVGPLIAVWTGFFMDVMGRKRTLMLASLFLVAGMLTMSQATSVVGLTLGRMLMHIGHRSGTSTTAVFMAELSPAALRGLLVSIEEILLNAGSLCPVLVSLAMGQDEIEWRNLCVIGSCGPLITILCLLVLPLVESPRYLNLQGRRDEARAVLRDVLQNDDSEVEMTLRLWNEDAGRDISIGHLWTDLGRFASNKWAWIACAVWFFREGCGITLLARFFPFFLHAGGMEMSVATTLFAIGQALKTLVLLFPVFYFLDSHGRRAALMLSATMCLLCAGGASAAFLCDWGGKVVAVFFIGFMGSFSLGYGPAPWVYCSEILPNHLRGTCFLLARFPAHSIEAVYLLWAPLVFESHAGLLFFVLIITNAAALAFYSRCPETKGMVLEDLGRNLDAS
jgi:major inositol transporter-like SP family MFS transporter